jgi:hypothetical protein
MNVAVTLLPLYAFMSCTGKLSVCLYLPRYSSLAITLSYFIKSILLYLSCYSDGVLVLDLPPTTLLQRRCACLRPPAHNAVTAMVCLLQTSHPQRCYSDGVLALDLPPTTLLQRRRACFRPPAHSDV